MAELQQATDAAREDWRQRAEKAEAMLAAVPVDDIRRAMADTTAQHYAWYGPIRRWLDSMEVQP